MGIRGLHTCLVKTVPNTIRTVDWAEWKGKRLGIDIQCFLYRSIANKLIPLEVIVQQIVQFKELGIVPVYIFDGKPPSEKESVTQKRKSERQEAFELCEELRANLNHETDLTNRDLLTDKIRDLESRFPTLTYEIKDEIKQFLYASGTMFISPNCEADTLLAYWVRRGVLDGVVSFDLDFLPRGCRLLVPKSANEAPSGSWLEYDPIEICKALKLSTDRFTEFCVLLGSDYTPTLPIVAWKTALQSIQRRETLSAIWAKHTFNNWRMMENHKKFCEDVEMLKKAVTILSGEHDDPTTIMENVQWTKWNAGAQAPEQNTLDEFRRQYTNWNPNWWGQLTA
jgi:flap endonuclease-1